MMTYEKIPSQLNFYKYVTVKQNSEIGYFYDYSKKLPQINTVERLNMTKLYARKLSHRN